MRSVVDSVAPLPDSERIYGRIREISEQLNEQLLAIRRDIHAHPEVAHQEHRTTMLVADRLRAAGLEPRRMPNTGLICDLGPEAGGGKRIALRADLDALPVEDLTGLAFASHSNGLAHACGHDVHTTCVLGAGLVLAQLEAEGQLDVPVRLVFQPAEEVQPSGAHEAIAAGAIDDVAEIYALHCDPRYDAGMIAVRAGAITSASDLVTIRLHGDGGHTSRPHLTQDMVYAVGVVLTQLPAVLDRRMDPRAGVNLTWGSVHSGSVHNAIPSSALIEGTLRVLDVRAWEDAGEALARTLAEVTAPYGVRAEIEHERGVPPVNNDSHAAGVISSAGRSMLGDTSVLVAEQSLGGEDFAWYLTRVPGALLRLGTRQPGGTTYDLHRGDLVVDEHAIDVGVQVLAATALLAGSEKIASGG